MSPALVRLPAYSLACTAALCVLALPLAWLKVVDARSQDLETDVAPPVATYPGARALSGTTEASVVVASQPLRPSLDVAARDITKADHRHCIVGRKVSDPVSCVFGDPDGGRDVYLVGGSHSEHLLPALEIVAKERGLALHTLLKQACPWDSKPTHKFFKAPHPQCSEWVQNVNETLVREKPDLVLTIGTRAGKGRGETDYVPDYFVKNWRKVVRAGIPLVAIRDTPRLGFDAPECAANAQRRKVIAASGLKLSPNELIAAACSVPRDEVLAEDLFADAPRLPRMQWVDLSDSYCREDVCTVVEGNVLVYRDKHHLTATYSRTLAPALDRRLGTATGWW